jgi:acetyltransferase-like isoleucine patch superfamily enzyme
MIAAILRRLTGRTYVITSPDLGYLFAKGALPIARGTLWSFLRLRPYSGLLLGPNIQFIVSNRLKLGRGVAIGGGSYIDCSARDGVRLGDRVTLREHAWIQGRSGLNEAGAGLDIGARSYIGPKAVLGIGGAIVIGEDVQIGAGLSIAAEAHVADAEGSFVSGHVARRGVTIGDRCWFGNNVTVLDGVEIGADCVVGAGSLVTRSIPSGTIAYGVPARPRRQAPIART